MNASEWQYIRTEFARVYAPVITYRQCTAFDDRIDTLATTSTWYRSRTSVAWSSSISLRTSDAPLGLMCTDAVKTHVDVETSDFIDTRSLQELDSLTDEILLKMEHVTLARQTEGVVSCSYDSLRTTIDLQTPSWRSRYAFDRLMGIAKRDQPSALHPLLLYVDSPPRKQSI
jgi:hypothetical protein